MHKCILEVTEKQSHEVETICTLWSLSLKWKKETKKFFIHFCNKALEFYTIWYEQRRIKYMYLDL